MPGVMTLDLLLTLFAVAVALSMRPWRGIGSAGPPWPWVAWCAALPLFWGVDRYAAMPIVQPMSGATLLMLLAGWPLAALALLPVALLTMLLADLSLADALHRLVWLGLVPATLALALGAAVRRWLPNHLFIYILGRGFFVTMLATALAGAAALLVRPAPVGTETADLLLARWLSAAGEASMTGMLVAIFVAFRPHWLATYSDRLYLRPPGEQGEP